MIDVAFFACFGAGHRLAEIFGDAILDGRAAFRPERGISFSLLSSWSPNVMVDVGNDEVVQFDPRIGAFLGHQLAGGSRIRVVPLVDVGLA